MRNERSGRGPKLPRSKKALELGLGSPRAEHQKFWLRTRGTRTGAAREAYVVFLPLSHTRSLKYFCRVSDESLVLRPLGGIGDGQGGEQGRGRDGS